MRTITLQEFKDLVLYDRLNRDELYGRFAFNAVTHKNLCDTVQVGDPVSFLEVEPAAGSPPSSAVVLLVQANVV